MFSKISHILFEEEPQYTKCGLHVVSKSALLFFLLIALISAMFQFKTNFFYSWDFLVDYLPDAQKLASGTVLPYPIGDFWSKRILFVAMLSILFKMFNGHIIVFYLFPLFIGLIGVAFITSASVLAYRFGGKLSALASCSLLMISSPIIHWAPRHIDALWPSILLISLFLLFNPQEEREMVKGLVCGFLAILALFCKETTILFFPVPFLFWVLKIVPGSMKRILGFYLIYGIGMVLWYFYFRAGPVYQTPNHIIPLNSFPRLVHFVTNGLWKYYNVWDGLLFTHYSLAHFLMLAVICFGIKSVRTFFKPDAYRLAKMSIIIIGCFIPFDIVVGVRELRISQNLLSPVLMFLMLGNFVENLATRIHEKASKMHIDNSVFQFVPENKIVKVSSVLRCCLKYLKIPIFILLLASMILLSITFEGKHYKHRFISKTIGSSILPGLDSRDQLQISMRGFELSKKLISIRGKNKNILIDSVPHVKGTNLVFSQLNVNMSSNYLPVFALVDHEKFYRRNRYRLEKTSGTDLIFRLTDLKNVIEIISKKKLIEYIIQNDINFIAFSRKSYRRSPILKLWAKELGKFQDTVNDGNIFYIYKVRKEALKRYMLNKETLKSKIFLNKDVLKYFHYVKWNEPLLWGKYFNELIRNVSALNRKNVNRLVNGTIDPSVMTLDEKNSRTK